VQAEASIAPERRNGVFISASRLALGRGDVPLAQALIDMTQDDEGDLWIRAKAAEQRGMVALRAGEHMAALRHFEHARTQSQRLGSDEAEAWALHGIAAAWLDLGAIDQAGQILALARERYLAIGNAHGVALVDDSMSQVLHGQGRTNEALMLSESALEVFRVAANHRRAGIALDNIGRYAREMGDLERARIAHLDAGLVYRDAGDPASFVAWLRRVVALMAATGDQTAAHHLSSLVQPLQERYGSRITGPELHELERLEPVPAVSATMPRGMPTGEIRPGRSLENAIEWAVGWLETPTHSRSMTSTSTPTSALDHLTRREREIVSLLVEGLTDQQIADRLGISMRTVSKHLSTAYGRLGVKSRKEAAALAGGH
jgi:DNA-binding CsgD family transcriptional regulator/tetratricopeptide (TPR) repeat protein